MNVRAQLVGGVRYGFLALFGGKKQLKATKGACLFLGLLVFYNYARIWEKKSPL